MALNSLKYGHMDDGNLELKYPKGCCGSSCSNGNNTPQLTEEDVKDIVGDMITDKISLKEVNDKLIFNGDVVAEDNYVKDGYFDAQNGNLVLKVGEGKEVKIKMRGMAENTLDRRYVLYSGYQYPGCNKPFSIILENDEALFGKCSDGRGIYSLASVNKRNIVELGTQKLPLNLQGLAERPKYNNFDSFALMSDIPDVSQFATTKWVREKISKAVFGEADLVGYVTEEEAEEKYATSPIEIGTIKAKAFGKKNLFVE